MIWLLDANVDIHLRSVVLAKGIVAESASYRGGTTLVNRALVTETVGAGFNCLLTRDVLFAESAARALLRFPAFAVVVVTLPQRHGLIIETHFWQSGSDLPSFQRRAG
jgi:hypothetical protein